MSIIEQNGEIKIGELKRMALEKAPTLSKKQIRQELSSFIGGLDSRTKYLFLNSKEINYIQVFKLETESVKKTVDHLIDFLNESSFFTLENEELVEHQMINIKDIEHDSSSSAGLYPDGHYFRLEAANWVVEDI